MPSLRSSTGYATRSPDPDDGRVVNVVLTPEGSRLAQRAAEVQEELRCRTQMADDAIDRLRADLVALTASLGID